MLKNLTLIDFKCYHQPQFFPLAQINVLTGLNGRGKSTVFQAILALAQSITKEGISKLSLQGEYYSLGSFEDVVFKDANNPAFSIKIITSDKVDNNLEFTFVKGAEQTSARINSLLVDGNDRVTDMGLSTVDDQSLLTIAGERLISRELGSTEDVVSLRNFRNLTYVSADRIGPVNRSRWEEQSKTPKLDVHGRNLLSVLDSMGQEQKAEVQKALSRILRGGRLDVSRDNDDVVLKLDSSDKGHLFKPTNVGFGYGYILSTLVALEIAEPGSIFIIENPEAHLHPGAQVALTGHIISVVNKKSLQLFVETHSDHIINQCLVEIKQGRIKTDDVSLLFFDREEDRSIRVSKLFITNEGHIPEAPVDFFDQIDKSLSILVGF